MTLTRQYLSTYGPATVKDVAHFFGARIRDTRSWVEALDPKNGLVEVVCGGRPGLIALAEDKDMLLEPLPGGSAQWPLRFLPMWEAMLMAHSDKSWTVPIEAERKAVWRKSAVVAATVVHRGRIVATWSQRAKRRHLDVEVQPLSGWRGRHHLGGVKQEALAVATHLGLEDAMVTVA